MKIHQSTEISIYQIITKDGKTLADELAHTVVLIDEAYSKLSIFRQSKNEDYFETAEAYIIEASEIINNLLRNEHRNF